MDPREWLKELKHQPLLIEEEGKVPNKENIRKWVAKLRDPNSQQAYGALGFPDGARCCLGVACDLAVEENVISPPEVKSAMMSWNNENVFLPPAVADWLGTNVNPVIDTRPRNNMNYENDSLAYLNDTVRLTFSQIADLIEWQFLSGEENEDESE